MSDGFQREVGEWGNVTFPFSSTETILNHLRDEVDELDHALRADPDGLHGHEEEAADCYLLLLHLAHRLDFDLAAEARKKFEVNKGRTWQVDRNERGYFKHVEAHP